MARIRSIKPEFWKSEAIACLDFFTRLVFIGLWTYVDDNGVGLDNTKLITAELFPLEDDYASVSREVRESLARLADAGRIRRYTVNGKAYLAVVNWTEHQKIDRPNKPRYPQPDQADDAITSENEDPRETLAQPSRDPRATPSPGAVDQGAGEQGNKDQGAPPPAAPREHARKRGTRLPDDFAITDDLKTWFAEKCPNIDGPRETEKFRNYWRAKSGKDATKVDWAATWKNWMLTAAERAGPSQRGPFTGANRHTSQRHDNPFAKD